MGFIKWVKSALIAGRRRTAAANFIVTRRCNLRCGYCNFQNKGKELPPSDWVKIAERLSKRFAVFSISGGEPTLYDGLPELIQGLSKIGIVGLCTNGKSLSSGLFEAISSLDYLNFSIDHLGDSEVSEKTGFENIDLMVEYSKRNSFKLIGTAVITNRNLNSIPVVISKLADYGIGTELQLVQNPGTSDSFDTPEKLLQLAKLLDKLILMKKAGFSILEADDYILGMVNFVKGDIAVHCLAGKAYLAVDTDGRLMPCQACNAVGQPILESFDLEKELNRLSDSVPKGCRCWWDCYYQYAQWANNPMAFAAANLIQQTKMARYRR